MVALLQIAVVEWGPAEDVFRTVALTARQWFVVVAVAATALALEEARKVVVRLIERLPVRSA
jgi:Ca2+-transporting ATPase